MNTEIKRSMAFFVIILAIIIMAGLMIGCAGLQKTSKEPVHAEKGTGITIWKIPVLGIGSWGQKEEGEKISYSYQENNSIYTVTAVVINSNDHTVHSFIYDGYYSKEQLGIITDRGMVFKVKPFAEIIVPEHFDRTRPKRKFIPKLLPNHQYSTLNFHLRGKKIIAITSNTFYTRSDESSYYTFRNRQYTTAAVINLPTIPKHLQPLKFQFDFDLGKILNSLF